MSKAVDKMCIEGIVGYLEVNDPDLKDIKPILNGLEQIGHKIDLTSYEPTKVSKLHMATILGETELVKELIQNGNQVNCQTRKKISPLLLAVFLDRHEIVTLLLESGANPNQISEPYFETPFQMAVIWGKRLAIEMMLDHGADLESKVGTGCSVLHLAIKYEQIEIAKFLMKKGVHVNSTDNVLQTPLHLAVILRRYEIIPCLLDYEANTNTTNYSKSTPLQIATKYCLREAMEILMKSGACLRQKNENGEIPLELCLTSIGYGYSLEPLTKIAQKALKSFAYNLH